jgi:hypothetical protein
MGTLWAVVVAVRESVLNVEPLYLRAAQTMGSGGAQDDLGFVDEHAPKVAAPAAWVEP